MYIEPKARRRTAILVAVLSLLVGGVVGYVVGSGSATSASDVAATARTKGADAASALARLPIEYEQAVKTSSGESSNTILEAIDNASSLLADAYRAAPWLGPTLRQPATDAVETLRADVRSGAPASQFQHDVDDAAAAIGIAFNLQDGS
ncbi:MAG: hypothetical protein QOG43_2225 [Actinomycetota bacterium]|nr:hypothetical protein [Actinomycetota bacterium]